MTSIVYNWELLPRFDSVEVTAPDGILQSLGTLGLPNSGDLHSWMSSMFGNIWFQY